MRKSFEKGQQRLKERLQNGFLPKQGLKQKFLCASLPFGFPLHSSRLALGETFGLWWSRYLLLPSWKLGLQVHVPFRKHTKQSLEENFYLRLLQSNLTSHPVKTFTKNTATGKLGISRVAFSRVLSYIQVTMPLEIPLLRQPAFCQVFIWF